MKKWQARRSFVSSNGKLVLTAKMFLGKEGDFQFITADELSEFIDNGREDDIQEMSDFFDLVKAGYSIIVRRKKRTDKSGNRYQYPNFNRNGNTDGAKVVGIGKMFDFVQGLYDNKFTINFTFDELIEEAEQA